MPLRCPLQFPVLPDHLLSQAPRSPLVNRLVACSGFRQTTRDFGVSHTTVMRLSERLGRHCLLFLWRDLQRIKLGEPVAIGGFRSFAHSRIHEPVGLLPQPSSGDLVIRSDEHPAYPRGLKSAGRPVRHEAPLAPANVLRKRLFPWLTGIPARWERCYRRLASTGRRGTSRPHERRLAS